MHRIEERMVIPIDFMKKRLWAFLSDREFSFSPTGREKVPLLRTVALRLRDSRKDVLPPPRVALHLSALRRWCLSQAAQACEALPPRATLQHRASTSHYVIAMIVPLIRKNVNGLARGPADWCCRSAPPNAVAQSLP